MGFIEEANDKLKKLGFKCQQCGNCCLQLGNNLMLIPEETERWKQSEDFVLSNYGYYHLSDFMDILAQTGYADLWFHPETGKELRKCPFLRKQRDHYRCLIYDLRPETCNIFPFVESTGELGDWADICPEVKRIRRNP